MAELRMTMAVRCRLQAIIKTNGHIKSESQTRCHSRRHRHRLCDNPSLTIRYIDNPPKLWRIILDAKLRIPLDCKVVTSPLAITIIITTPQSIASESAKHQQLIDRGRKSMADCDDQ